MFISQVEIVGFRNISHLHAELSAGTTLITGRNGQGKTSLLEAIYLLTFPRSFRPGSSKDLLPWAVEPSDEISSYGQSVSNPASFHPPQIILPLLARSQLSGSALVAAMVESGDGQSELVYQLSEGRKESFFNGKRSLGASAFFGKLRAVVFTPDDLQLIKGSPQLRRQFLDRTLSLVAPEYLEQLLLYQRVLKSRNAVLVEARTKRMGQRELEPMLEPWDLQLCSFGRKLSSARSELVQFLSSKVPEYYRRIATDQAREQVSIQLESELLGAGQQLGDEQLLQRLKAGLRRDMATGNTSFGVHRDDLILSLFGANQLHSARLSASQGQSRSLSLALKLASVDYIAERSGEPPVLMLDDVESELDARRRHAFASLVASFGSQILITATEPSTVFTDLVPDLRILSIESGKLSDSSP